MIKLDIADPLYFMKMEILEVLHLVMDPELHINIIDMGLVYDVRIDTPEKKVNILMTLSSRYCPMGESIVSAVKNCIELHFPQYQAETELVWEPVWSYDDITEEGKRLLSN